MRRPVGFLAVTALLLGIAALAHRSAPAANVPEVLIGNLLPLTGNFASLGQQYLWADQTVEDIVNNDYPDLRVPLGPGKGFPGLGGAPMKLVTRDDQSHGDLARTIAEQLITVTKVHWLNGTLSGGEQQMLAIARALMSRPRFLMLDEPSLGIMPRLVDAIMEVLSRLHRIEGLTLFLVEQNVPAALDLADRGYVLQTGRVVLEGPSAVLLGSERVRQAYLGI